MARIIKPDPLEWVAGAEDRMRKVLIEGLRDEAWMVEIKDGQALIMRGLKRPDGAPKINAIRIEGRRVGEFLEGLRSPLQEIFSEMSMRFIDDAPLEIRRMIHEHGARVQQLWEQGFDAPKIRHVLGLEQDDLKDDV